MNLGRSGLEREPAVPSLEDQHRVALVLLQAVDGGDVGMTQRREELRLAPESFEAMRIGREALGRISSATRRPSRASCAA